MSMDTLVRLQDKAISPEEAYEKLYKKPKSTRVPFFRRAHFVKLKINVPDQKGVNSFLRVLFFIPMPLLILRILLSFAKLDQFNDDIQMSKREIINLISHRGIKVQVNTHSGEKVLIKTL